ncbi:MAG: formylmethanofuran--tetrahydromethanopterin N-formyltransferase [Methanobacterium sp.]|nr:formylmethanofuran--tetrahydromethanopterin N-formyltransferase [Methanobacterium sp.]
MQLDNVEIEDTFAEAFDIYVSKFLITAATEKFAKIAADETVGFGSSVIMCPAEAGIDRYIPPSETPDGRPGYEVMICHPKKDELEHQLLERIGQCVLTSATTAVFDAMGSDADEKLKVGFKLKFFGDGFESKDEIAGRTVYRIPIMSGDFIIEGELGIKRGVAGGNFFIMAENQASALVAAEVAVDAIENIPGTITPFPGGIVASGSKIGSKYKFMAASTNEKFCPTLRGTEGVACEIPEGINGIYEIVIDGISEEAIATAMKEGIKAAVKVPGVKRIYAGNYDGTLGAYQIWLEKLF